MIRTKILRVLRQNGWTSLGITSPTSGCGKTTACLNIAFSLAHQPDVQHGAGRPRPAPPGGRRAASASPSRSRWRACCRAPGRSAENFVRYGETLAIGTNTTGLRAASEILLNARHRPGGRRASSRPSSPT